MSATTDGSRKVARLGTGNVHYREEGEGEPIVFIHGFGVDSRLWSETAAALAGEHRCILPDLPLGSHTEAMAPNADQTAPGVVRLIAEFLESLDLDGVTIVGNDSGGALSQILVTEHPTRIARLVLTNSDCFENFPPKHFKAMSRAMRLPGIPAAFAHSMRVRSIRRSPVAYGALTETPIDDSLLRSWTEPQLEDAGVRRDGARFFASADTRDTMRAAEKLPALEIPALLVWGDADRFFTVEDARRIAGLIPDSKLVEVLGGKTFLPLDRPGEVAKAIAEFVAARPLAGAIS